MPLIASVSGIRGVVGDGLDAAVLVRYTAAFAGWLRQTEDRPTVVVGRDGRDTGEVCARIVTATLQASGCDVVDGGLATTPSVAMGVLKHEASGAIILSASHNPAEWNALKLLGPSSAFLTPEEGGEVLKMAEQEPAAYAVGHKEVGSYVQDDLLPYHIEKILALDLIDPEAIRARGFRVVVDGINSVGAFAIPALLRELGVSDIEVLNGEVNGQFAHNPEPLPHNVTGIMERVKASGADLGVVVDPDADRLAFVEDGGAFFGEELTQVVAADFVLGHTPGPIVTNLSSSRAMDDIAAKHGQESYRAAVGEINVVQEMRRVSAIVGGEGAGGVILPELHYGRDALVGVALTLQYLAESGKALSEIRAGYPAYHIAKHKLPLAGLDAKTLLASLAESYEAAPEARVSTVDGVKVDLPEGWVHVRTSNTEPIVRVYAEAETASGADALAERFKRELVEA